MPDFSYSSTEKNYLAIYSERMEELAEKRPIWRLKAGGHDPSQPSTIKTDYWMTRFWSSLLVDSGSSDIHKEFMIFKKGNIDYKIQYFIHNYQLKSYGKGTECITHPESYPLTHTMQRNFIFVNSMIHVKKVWNKCGWLSTSPGWERSHLSESNLNFQNSSEEYQCTIQASLSPP